jgi:hypothetical protein
METKKPWLIYWLPYEDDREMVSLYSRYQDYVCCVMAENQKEAIQKTIQIAQSTGVPYVKIMGVAIGREEWVNEESPLKDSSPKATNARNKTHI